jgi:hypothetical protein
MTKQNSSSGKIYNIQLFVPSDLEEIYNIKTGTNEIGNPFFLIRYKKYNLSNEFVYVTSSVVQETKFHKDGFEVFNTTIDFIDFNNLDLGDFKELYICFFQEGSNYFTNSGKILARDWINIIHIMLFWSDHKYKDSLTRIEGIPFFKTRWIV